MSDRAVERLSLMIVAGEPSGDAHAAALVRSLSERAQARGLTVEFFGATGSEMRAAGVESIVESDHLAITGLLEEARALPKFWRAYQRLRNAALERRPDAVVLVDWPDFNMRLARVLHRRALKIVYYISPQLWAWRAYRTRNIRRDVDLLLAILPFEPAWYGERGISHVEFVGHPLAGTVRPRYGRTELCARHHLDPSQPIIALLPGSRRKELERILPPMLEAAVRIWRARPLTQFIIPLAANRSPAEAERLISAAQRNGSLPQALLRITQHETREVLAGADAAAVASGTATLEAALLGTPLVVVYKESTLNWHLLGRLIKTEHFGLVNLIAGRRIAPELMQNDFTAERLAEELLALLDEERNRAVRRELQGASARLGQGGASRRAADAILRLVHGQNAKQPHT